MSTQEFKPAETIAEKKSVVHLNSGLSARINAASPAIRDAINVKTLTFTDAVHHLACLGLQHYEPQG